MARPTIPPNLIAEVRTQYEVGFHYASAYLEYWLQGQPQAFNSLAEILALPMPMPMWFDYAMTTNQRGRQFAQSLSVLYPIEGGRYLDVGCGFGGYLNAFARLGLDVWGIEIDPERIGLSEANCLDQGLQDRVLRASILEGGLPEKLGCFDLITCIDVIEHVSDAAQALHNMAALLKPGGLLVLEIPNKHYLNFVAQDDHFSLPAITLLARPDAERYQSTFFKSPYDIGDYYPLETYLGWLEKLNCQPQVVPSLMPPPVRILSFQHLKNLSKGYRQYKKLYAPRLPKELRDQIEDRFRQYLVRVTKDFLRLLAHPGQKETFRTHYLSSFWTVTAVKGPLPDGS
jgi:2-polyprenyl-3-methyl-5-hydroxy-6-metoxy-1,4-benzoquinol methylase